jgi:hypothetical protein
MCKPSECIFVFCLMTHTAITNSSTASPSFWPWTFHQPHDSPCQNPLFATLHKARHRDLAGSRLRLVKNVKFSRSCVILRETRKIELRYILVFSRL